jgi:hypothetical protein
MTSLNKSSVLKERWKIQTKMTMQTQNQFDIDMKMRFLVLANRGVM